MTDDTDDTSVGEPRPEDATDALIYALRASDLGPEPSKSTFGAELHRLALETGATIIGIDRGGEETVSLAFSRRRPDGDMELLDLRTVSISDVRRVPDAIIWRDEARDIPPEVWAALAERVQARRDEIENIIVTGSPPCPRDDFWRLRFDEPMPLTIPSPERFTGKWTNYQTTTTLGLPKPPRPDLTDADIERLRLAEQKRARKAAKRRGKL